MEGHRIQNSPAIAPIVYAGDDRDVMLGGKTWLAAEIRSVHPITRSSWTKTSGPGEVTFTNPAASNGTATFTKPGTYTLKFTAWQGEAQTSSPLLVKVVTPPLPNASTSYTQNTIPSTAGYGTTAPKPSSSTGSPSASNSANAPTSPLEKAGSIILSKPQKR
ncbi:hypothetical protein ACQ86N_19205 [Puia sp. P3]|uniref:hypothetical protein n=1 Tax=Puia sp. P3 TaxID=3423952 RepID=UPI003D664068